MWKKKKQTENEKRKPKTTKIEKRAVTSWHLASVHAVAFPQLGFSFFSFRFVLSFLFFVFVLFRVCSVPTPPPIVVSFVFLFCQCFIVCVWGFFTIVFCFCSKWKKQKKERKTKINGKQMTKTKQTSVPLRHDIWHQSLLLHSLNSLFMFCLAFSFSFFVPMFLFSCSFRFCFRLLFLLLHLLCHRFIVCGFLVCHSAVSCSFQHEQKCFEMNKNKKLKIKGKVPMDKTNGKTKTENKIKKTETSPYCHDIWHQSLPSHSLISLFFFSMFPRCFVIFVSVFAFCVLWFRCSVCVCVSVFCFVCFFCFHVFLIICVFVVFFYLLFLFKYTKKIIKKQKTIGKQKHKNKNQKKRQTCRYVMLFGISPCCRIPSPRLFFFGGFSVFWWPLRFFVFELFFSVVFRFCSLRLLFLLFFGVFLFFIVCVFFFSQSSVLGSVENEQKRKIKQIRKKKT